MFLLKVCHALSNEQVNYAVVGGYAVALHGAVRGTVDVDLIIQWEKEQLIAFEKSMHSIGLVSRLPIDAEQLFHFRDEYIKNRNLLVWNFNHPEDMSQQVDLIICHDLSGFKTVEKWLNSQTIKVLNIEDLINMKQQAGRPQDLEDIKSLNLLK